MNLKPLSEHSHLLSIKEIPNDCEKPCLYSRGNTLILVKKDGRAAFACNIGDKDMLLNNYDEKAGDALIIIWAGQWSSDAYEIDGEDLPKLLCK